jgi:GNAT superfamily N-acetyltransferase
MPWHLKTEGNQVLVVRDRDQKVVGRHKDRKKATAQLKVLYSLEKAQFASRTEAARYAANQRWKNHTPKEKADAIVPGDLKIVEIRGNETFGPYKDGTFTRRATFTVLDDDGKEMWVDVTAKGVKGSQFIEVEAKRGKKQIGYLWAETDHDGKYGQKGKIAIGQVDVVANERRKGVATALMRLGKRYNIGSETIYHSTVLTSAGAAFAEDTDIEKASFGGDRSAAGRYAAEQRWKGNAKDGLLDQVTVDFESDGKDSGTVWATDNATGKVVGALKFDANFIAKIYVANDYRRKGIGSFLYSEAKKRNGGVDMKADDYTVSGAGFMSAVTGKEVYQTGDNSWAGIEWKSWLERLERDALEKASFGGDRSAAGRYAAQQRWKGHKKDATKPAVRERRMAEKFQEGPILKSGFDGLGFPKILTPAEAKKRFGETVTMHKAYFASRGIDLYVDAQYSDGQPKFDTESPAYYATLQALDDVLDQVDTTKLTPDPKNGLFPYVGISGYYQNSADTTGGYFDSSRNDVALFMNVSKLVEESYTKGPRLSPGTVPQMAADVIQASPLGRNDSVAARIAYGFTVHEMGHWIDYSLGVTDKGFEQYRSYNIVARAKRDGQLASDDEQRFSDFSDRSYHPRGVSYSNTNHAERFAENFTAWFTMTKVNVSTINQLKSDLASRGGLVAVGAALEVLKQDRIVDNLLNWSPDHPVFLFAFRGQPFDVDAFKQQLLVGMIKASFGGDRSAAGRYAANMRWQGQRKVAGFVGKGVYKLGADGSIHPKALLEEMLAEHPDGSSGYHQSTEPGKWKALVCKNIATNMTDVSTTEIMDVIDGFGGDDNNHSVIKPTASRHIREVLDGTVKRFILSKDGTVIDASKEDFVARQSTRPDLEPAIDGSTLMRARIDFNSKYWDQMAAEGQVFDANTPEGQIALKQAAVKPLVDAWATTANDAHELSLAIQDATQKVFKVDALSWNSGTTDAGDWDGGSAEYSNKDTYKPSSTISDARTKVLSSFLLAQYAATQQYFDAKGIKEITLFRGMKRKPSDPDRGTNREFISPLQPPEKAEILMRPLSSWATRLDDAAFFAKSSHGQPFGTIVKARIKTKDILSIPYTGVGCWEEAEVVVIGRPVQGSFRASYKSPIMNPEERRDYESQVTEWAYEDETGEAP